MTTDDQRIRDLESKVAVLVNDVARADRDARDFREEIRAAMRRMDERAEQRDRETKELLRKQEDREEKRDKEREQERKDRDKATGETRWQQFQRGATTVTLFLMATGLLLNAFLR